jgi:hypothetical protein
MGLVVALAAVAATAVGAGLIDLPDAACNDGTATAHESIPAETGAGGPVPAHDYVPRTVDDGCVSGVASE